MADKKTFIMYKGWDEMLRALPDEDLGRVMKAVLAFQDGEELEVDNPVLNAIVLLIKAQMRTDASEYEKTCEKRREAGAKGGEATQSKNKQKVANASLSQANQADNDNEYDNDNDIKEKNIKKSKSFSPPTPEDVKAYCDESGYKVDPNRFVDFYASKGWMVGKNKMKDWKACVRTWAKSDTTRAVSNKFNNIDGRKYDFAALEREARGG